MYIGFVSQPIVDSLPLIFEPVPHFLVVAGIAAVILLAAVTLSTIVPVAGALKESNLEVREGEFVSIMGPSGCGKSTLLNIAGLLDEPTSGTVELHGKPVSGLNAREAARFRNTELGFVFQSFHLIPSLNVLDNVQMPLLYRRMGVSSRAST